ncbi:DUF4258 domain-containing protein [Candidatus Poribacteria bacterium]|nr:DUF4258 domain-containing protein [Candidatus Poribacteria bacterium]
MTELPFDLEKVRQLTMLGRIELSRHAVRRCMRRQLMLDHLCSAIYSGTVIHEDPEAHPDPTMTIAGQAKGYQEVKLVCTVVEEVVRVITVANPYNT